MGVTHVSGMQAGGFQGHIVATRSLVSGRERVDPSRAAWRNDG
jgi:hypothetical protein